jgi:hypothetical protein
MKTAICFSGRLCYLNHFENHYSKVIEPYKADVFIDTWMPMTQASAVWSPSADDMEKIRLFGQMPDIESVEIQSFINSYRPKLLNMEFFDLMPLTHQIRSVLPPSTKTSIGHESPHTKKENVLFMWYKIWKCNQLRKLYEQINRIRYDVVIRMRFDSTFDEVPVIDPKRKTVYIPSGGDYEGGVCDQFAIADSVTMDIYCELWNEIYRYSTAGIGIHPESLLRKHLDVNRLDVARFPAGLKLRGEPQ